MIPAASVVKGVLLIVSDRIASEAITEQVAKPLYADVIEEGKEIPDRSAPAFSTERSDRHLRRYIGPESLRTLHVFN